ncbi:MAG: gamma carbonic anhydrase family protein [Bacteroidia bacterium]|nr:gamma carbonic anhydrase family protein [Bacteroidia bacterium]MDG2042201.1 gamma carbonic anhydrase family protein [Bacteroidia bacterium]|tara:strand:+ start:1330 stop:1836 length:507 start_codon:yes stop_codon:yes gene_type:complete
MKLNQVILGKDVFIAPSATVIGDVSLKDNASVWFGAVLRGDSDQISIGAQTNIQDNAVIHCDPGQPTIIGETCIIGHGAIVHGAQLANHVLIGMNATILNDAKIGEFSIIGANALVTSGTVIPPRSLVLGSPAKVVRTITKKEEENIKQNAEVYVKKAQEYRNHYAGL